MEQYYKFISNPGLNRQILDSIADLIRVIDFKNQIIYANKALQDLLGYDTERKLSRIDREGIDTVISRRTYETGEVIQREETIGGKLYSVKSSPLEKDGHVIGVVEVFRNIDKEQMLLSEIMERNKAMTIEMNHAQKIQSALLPAKGFLSTLKVDYLYHPSNMLSGDMFDIFPINDDNVGIYIADTVGHGFASSMITMFIRIAMRNISRDKKLAPAKLLEELSQRFVNLGLDGETYFTCFYCVYNKKKSLLTYANAGHFPSPIVATEKGSEELVLSGFPISPFFKGSGYESDSIRLKTGDKLCLMTDGLSETMDYNGEQFGTDRVKAILQDNDNDELLVLKRAVYNFMWGEQRDDLTALLIKVW
ncbi:SpoIIE family protein phosphatase [Peptoniphilus equinus]|uniref:SpoIIE family protein phosphatase n=1 Tax=Peptoniphilus equinus TaxID=3016343 RepID=A0ABY7QVP3_9FIRM|nr:SpoIIE family protein phosphatase [Peptoniphilus equinus]WBW50258.1 SpoIIE family protein phosphatase [Peptoniphilus equinus]